MTLLDFLKDKKICFLGAHPDDIELGAGGTLNQLRELKPHIEILSTSHDIPGNETIRADLELSMRTYGLSYVVGGVPTRKFQRHFLEIRDNIFSLSKLFDVFFTHSPRSQHTDHRIIGEGVDDICKNHSIFCWEEINTGRYILPNMWNRLAGEDIMVKERALDCYQSQKRRPYFEEDAVLNLARMRGLQIQATYAEAFEVLRLVP